MLKNIPPYIKFVFRVYLLIISAFTLLRIILFILVQIKWGTTVDQGFKNISTAFLFGLRFDSAVIGYIFLIPFLILGFCSFLKKTPILVTRFILYFLLIFIALSTLISCSDIPYFFHFFSRFSINALMWMKYGTYSVKMIFGEPYFYWFLGLFIVINIPVFVLLRKFSRQFINYKNKEIKVSDFTKIWQICAWFLIVGFLIFVAIRGRISTKSTIRPGTAFFCNDPFLNQLGLNPVFTFFRSIEAAVQDKNRKVQLMNPEKAFKNVHSYLNIPEKADSLFSIYRNIRYQRDSATKPNIFIVIMESMGMYKLGWYNGPKELTPHLNKLILSSYFFDRFYAAGNHTFNGLYSTLFSYPALLAQQPLEIYYDIPHKGLANILKDNGYKTCFFTTQDAQFDNMEGFLNANGFDTIISENNYPKEWIVNANGIPDHKMFEYSIPVINRLSKGSKPLFCVFLTASDHVPYCLPDKKIFKPKSTEIEDKITEYADWSIGLFMKNISGKKWYQNSVFALVADHGNNMGHTYDLPLSGQHIPFIIHSPIFAKKSEVFHNFGGQIDIAPTILGLLKISYSNNTLGVDLLKEKRPFMYFCADGKIGCLDSLHYLIIRDENPETLYEYKNLETRNLIKEFQNKVDSMKAYTFSMMQATQWIMDSRKLK